MCDESIACNQSSFSVFQLHRNTGLFRHSELYFWMDSPHFQRNSVESISLCLIPHRPLNWSEKCRMEYRAESADRSSAGVNSVRTTLSPAQLNFFGGSLNLGSSRWGTTLVVIWE